MIFSLVYKNIFYFEFFSNCTTKVLMSEPSHKAVDVELKEQLKQSNDVWYLDRKEEKSSCTFVEWKARIALLKK